MSTMAPSRRISASLTSAAKVSPSARRRPSIITNRRDGSALKTCMLKRSGGSPARSDSVNVLNGVAAGPSAAGGVAGRAADTGTSAGTAGSTGSTTVAAGALAGAGKGSDSRSVDSKSGSDGKSLGPAAGNGRVAGGDAGSTATGAVAVCSCVVAATTAAGGSKGGVPAAGVGSLAIALWFAPLAADCPLRPSHHAKAIAITNSTAKLPASHHRLSECCAVAIAIGVRRPGARPIWRSASDFRSASRISDMA